MEQKKITTLKRHGKELLVLFYINSQIDGLQLAFRSPFTSEPIGIPTQWMGKLRVRKAS